MTTGTRPATWSTTIRVTFARSASVSLNTSLPTATPSPCTPTSRLKSIRRRRLSSSSREPSSNGVTKNRKYALHFAVRHLTSLDSFVDGNRFNDYAEHLAAKAWEKQTAIESILRLCYDSQAHVCRTNLAANFAIYQQMNGRHRPQRGGLPPFGTTGERQTHDERPRSFRSQSRVRRERSGNRRVPRQ